MASLCVIDVKFLQNQDRKIFAKKIVVSGILYNAKLYSKEIVFPHPINDFERPNFDENIEFGSGDIQLAEQDFIRTIGQFNAIMVADNVQEKFIKRLIKNKNVKIVNVEGSYHAE